MLRRKQALCPPRRSQKEGRAPLPSSVPQCCRSKAGPGRGLGPGEPGGPPGLGFPRLAPGNLSLPAPCHVAAEAMAAAAKLGSTASEDGWQVAAGHSCRTEHVPHQDPLSFPRLRQVQRTLKFSTSLPSSTVMNESCSRKEGPCNAHKKPTACLLGDGPCHVGSRVTWPLCWQH